MIITIPFLPWNVKIFRIKKSNITSKKKNTMVTNKLSLLISSRFQVDKPKIFCISMQRTGTTSVGQFLKDHGYRVAGYGSHSKVWSDLWEKGDYEGIFRSTVFKSYQAYEDNPWWFPDFYRLLNHRFPKAKFILLYRDSDKWFDSMLSHKIIKTLTNNYRHNKIYRKLDLYYDRIDNDPNFVPGILNGKNDIPFNELKDRYKAVYEEYNRDAIEYFKKYAPEKLFYTSLEDKEKWKKMADFLKIKIEEGYDIHTNKTVK